MLTDLTKAFIAKAIAKHGYRYLYNKVICVGNKIKVIITCPIHGDFLQSPREHLKGAGCPKCGLLTSAVKPRSNTEEFIRRAIATHGYRYLYDKVVYVTAHVKVIITCPIHGDFEQTPNSHIRGCGCPKCADENIGNLFRSNTQEFIAKAMLVHGNRYGYGKVMYTGRSNSVIITCPIHGDFEQLPGSHLQGHGCPNCRNDKLSTDRRFSLEEFIAKARIIHGDKFDYSKVVYINSWTKVIIICPIHGEFEQIPNSHLQGKGCYKCGRDDSANMQRLTVAEFIERAMSIHGNKCGYNKVVLENTNIKVILTCLVDDHGDFLQTPQSHLQGAGCPKCGILTNANNQRLTLAEFIAKARLIHGDKFDYSKVVYINNNTKVIIICSIHGDFEQTPSAHLQGNGCPGCKESRGEKAIARIFNEANIKYVRQLKDPCHRYWYDFYLPDYNLLVEFHGGQHYYPIPFFDGEEGLKKTQRRDTHKRELAKLNGKHIVYFNYKHLRLPFEEFQKLILTFLDKVTNRRIKSYISYEHP